ncbi:hypothetical protein FB567DRAFT_173736 [Paraphoma chrysanthemicola]|uniref:Protein kinase domain-containing protein n=1 Tax=Paraphoma chrysanthemicola TaxID=798071 RepID=A0A8K0RHI1_9PLEO|nr:hypothetical protein FB567DRAFT_173736 [Paraphoma chrysanthemicola]
MTDKAVADLDKALGIWFPPGQPAQSVFSESDIKEIVDTLRRHKQESWSRIPRIYITLRLTGHLDVIDIFLDTGTSDISFPFTPQTLPGTLKDVNARSDFIEKQVSVLTKGLDLEKEHGKHRHLASTEDTPFEKIQELGKGGYGYVDRVRSNISYREYARKLIPRGRTFRKDKVVLRDFERELGTLKKLAHRHIVELVGSYTDPKYVGLIMSPVADWNLDDFLDRDYIPPEDLSFLRTFYGCLAKALQYLHDNQIRHKDIKPQNVLVKGHHVYLTDFGLSLDWSEIGASTTTGPSSKTLRYCAPEVAANQSRNSGSDLWSLGCVFLEIWTTLCGTSVADLLQYLSENGSKSTCYYANVEAILSWIQSRNVNDTDDSKRPIPWILSMLELSHTERCTVASLCKDIAKVNRNHLVRVSFMGRCCSEDEDSAESVCSTDNDTTEDGEGAVHMPTKQIADRSAPSLHLFANSEGIMTECLPEPEAGPTSELQEKESQPEQSMSIASTGLQPRESHGVAHHVTNHIDPVLSGSLLYMPLWAGQPPTKYKSKYFWFAEHPFRASQLMEVRIADYERIPEAIAWSTQTKTGVLCFAESAVDCQSPREILNLAYADRLSRKDKVTLIVTDSPWKHVFVTETEELCDLWFDAMATAMKNGKAVKEDIENSQGYLKELNVQKGIRTPDPYLRHSEAIGHQLVPGTVPVKQPQADVANNRNEITHTNVKADDQTLSQQHPPQQNSAEGPSAGVEGVVKNEMSHLAQDHHNRPPLEKGLRKLSLEDLEIASNVTANQYICRRLELRANTRYGEFIDGVLHLEHQLQQGGAGRTRLIKLRKFKQTVPKNNRLIQRTIRTGPLEDLVTKMIAVLAGLGFAYRLRGDGVTCGYPTAVALHLTQVLAAEPSTRGTVVEQACSIMRSTRNIGLLEYWKSWIDAWNESKSNDESNAEKQLLQPGGMYTLKIFFIDTSIWINVDRERYRDIGIAWPHYGTSKVGLSQVGLLAGAIIHELEDYLIP